MNLILLFEPDRRPDGRFQIRDARAHHVRTVLRSVPGDRLRVGLLDGPLGAATVESVTDDAVLVAVDFEDTPPPRPPVDLLLAVPRPKSLRKLLPQVTALGVDRIVLVRAWRAERAYVEAALADREAFAPLLYEGLMQARCTRLPQVTVEPLFRPFVEDRAAAAFAGARRLLAHPVADRALSLCRVATHERVVLAVGPEGGWVPFEVELLVAAGFEPVSLGPRVLRVETACVAALAQLDLLRRLPVPDGLGGEPGCGSLDPA